MRIKHLLRLYCFLGLAWLATTGYGQQMPQDNWRNNNHQFTGPNPNNYLYMMAIGAGGVYVSEGAGWPGTSVLQFDEHGSFIRRFSTNFAKIGGIACDPAGYVYVVDRELCQVSVFDQNGIFLRAWGSAGNGDGQFNLTYSGWGVMSLLAVDKDSQVYVCDPGNSRVQVFDTNGNFLRKWGVQGNLPTQFGAGFPSVIAVSEDGNVYVLSRPSTMSVFRMDGTYQTSAGIVSPIDAFSVTPDGLVIVYSYFGGDGDFYLHRIYDSGLTMVGAFDGLYAPYWIAINRRGDVYEIRDHYVAIYEREYSSVRNPPTPLALPEPVVLAMSQRTNTAWLDVDYQVIHVAASNVTAAALAFVNGVNSLSYVVQMNTFMENTSTNLGANMPSNTKLHFTWNMGADWSIDFGQIQVEVLAKDNRNLMGFHWITVPSDGANPAFQVSSAPVPESELLSVWYWLVATHNCGVAFTNGTVTGQAGDFDGQLLANGYGTTTAGRFFAYSQMNVRAITPSEITRANAGRYGFSSVDVNSVVKLP